MVIVFTISCKTKTIVANVNKCTATSVLPDHNGTASLNGRTSQILARTPTNEIYLLSYLSGNHLVY